MTNKDSATEQAFGELHPRSEVICECLEFRLITYDISQGPSTKIICQRNLEIDSAYKLARLGLTGASKRDRKINLVDGLESLAYAARFTDSEATPESVGRGFGIPYKIETSYRFHAEPMALNLIRSIGCEIEEIIHASDINKRDEKIDQLKSMITSALWGAWSLQNIEASLESESIRGSLKGQKRSRRRIWMLIDAAACAFELTRMRPSKRATMACLASGLSYLRYLPKIASVANLNGIFERLPRSLEEQRKFVRETLENSESQTFDEILLHPGLDKLDVGYGDARATNARRNWLSQFAACGLTKLPD